MYPILVVLKERKNLGHINFGKVNTAIIVFKQEKTNKQKWGKNPTTLTNINGSVVSLIINSRRPKDKSSSTGYLRCRCFMTVDDYYSNLHYVVTVHPGSLFRLSADVCVCDI